MTFHYTHPDELIANALPAEIMQDIRDRARAVSHLHSQLITAKKTEDGATAVILHTLHEGNLPLATVPDWAADAGMADHIKHAHGDITRLLQEVDRLQALADLRGQQQLAAQRRELGLPMT